MNLFAKKMLVSGLFTALLLAVYILELSERWAYMGFNKFSSPYTVATTVVITTLLSAIAPLKFNTRNFLVAIIIYIFYLPSFIIVASNGLFSAHFAALLFSLTIVYCISLIQVRPLCLGQMNQKQFLIALFFLFLVVVIALALLGGVNRFNLNILRVYEFRNSAEVQMPTILAYLYSGVSKVVAPIIVLFAILLRSKSLAAATFLLIILMFGFVHHKSVLFLPLAVGILFYIFRDRTNTLLIPVGLMVIMLISFLETVYYLYADGLGLFTSFIVRRIFFIPPLLDSFYIDFFSTNQYLFWSTSRFGFGLAENPYFASAPFVIGFEYFGSEQTGANSGIIGSGYANAGIFGVLFYSSLLSLIIALLQSYGRIYGHALVSCVAVSVVITIANTSDLSTVVLTHGLAVLFLLLLVFPRNIAPA